ncbi:EGF-like domain protein [Ancylostoma ceylanicum]|uniref:EGF-like domain protein n=1 Tax=Ancylostoma ceylanicum TaxID=53326 RepID=A0A0D6LGU2_9BILA|nr:EGF-like domain protein [Ancylostoma ceylanicum]
MFIGVVILALVTVSLAAPAESEATALPASVSRAAKKFAAGESDSLEENAIEDVKKELNRAVQGLNNTVVDNNEKVSNAISDITGRVAVGRDKYTDTESANLNNLDTCTSLECNNRGTCLGTKKTYICACHLGYSGKNCEDTVCDSTRDCNGRGICLGTTTSLTCLCNLGFTGRRCERIV